MPATRLQGIFFWDLFIYLIEGTVFLVTGLQARTLTAGIHGYSLRELVMSALVVCAVVIVARFVWIYPATYVPRWLSPSLARRDPSPPWQFPFALGFTGRARHRLAGRGTGDSVDDRGRRRVSSARPRSCSSRSRWCS